MGEQRVLYPQLHLSGPLTTAIQMFKDTNVSYNMAFEYKPRPSGAQPETVMCSNPDLLDFLRGFSSKEIFKADLDDTNFTLHFRSQVIHKVYYS